METTNVKHPIVDEYDFEDETIGLIVSYLKQLREPYKTESLSNLDVVYIQDGVIDNLSSIADALCYAFDWEDSDEGYNYWWNVYELLNNDERDNPECGQIFNENIIIIGRILNEDEDQVNRIILNQLSNCGKTTARKVSKLTNPHISCTKVLDIAVNLGFTLKHKAKASKTKISN